MSAMKKDMSTSMLTLPHEQKPNLQVSAINKRAWSSSSSSPFSSGVSTPLSLSTPLSEVSHPGTTKPGILIANRGEIAHRIHRTLLRIGIPSILLHTAIDLQSPSLISPSALSLNSYNRDIEKPEPKCVLLSGATLEETYLSIPALISAAKENGAQGIIPGYGFLSESAEFAEACEANELLWIGPTAAQMRMLGLKHEARSLASRLNIALLPGSGVLKDVNHAVAEANRIGYPVMMKSSAGGGGMGMSCCADENELRRGFASVESTARRHFAYEDVFVEKFVKQAKHVEVQIVGDGKGRARHLGLRDCSLQRRWQKIIEETPPSFLPEVACQKMCDAAVKLVASVNYRSVGTVEFIYDLQTGEFYFIEVNARLQVEHTITEEATGIDIVEMMLRIAFDEADYFFDQPERIPRSEGVAIEARICGESPLQNFLPSTGQLLDVSFPDDVRVETFVTSGTVISPLYDPLIAKIIVKGIDRLDAVQNLSKALGRTTIVGIETNLEYLKQILRETFFQEGRYTTSSLSTLNLENVFPVFEVLEPGQSTTIQDFPGRVGYWNIGIPPSGPMDNYAFRVANKMLHNDPGAAALECTFSGPTLLFHHDAFVSIEGGSTKCELNAAELVRKDFIRVSAGDQLRVGTIVTGCRAYIAIGGGIIVPKVFGSASTFVLGNIGGTCGRELRKGDLITFKKRFNEIRELQQIQRSLYPSDGRCYLRVMVGPHAAPDYFDAKHFDEFFNGVWKVHYNSNRVGIRLTGPKPKWARTTGGEAGLHPSNIHDSPYSIGSISFTGDEAVILGCDGPSLGGFVIFSTVITADLWKMGQMKAGDEAVLVPVSAASAAVANKMLELFITNTSYSGGQASCERADVSMRAVLGNIGSEQCCVLCRQAGDAAMLLEFGEDCFDIKNSARIYGITHAHKQAPLPGVLELTPGVRSLLVSYDKNRSQKAMLSLLRLVVSTTSSTFLQSPIPSRTYWLPFAFRDSASSAAVERYEQTIRQKAPWLPDNVEFLRRINGLDTKEDVQEILTDATFLVMGLGDVFFGSPCAIPLDPRHRLFGMKYNPSRSFTAEGTVGIGGQYMCIYGINSPGGYQLVGRTIPIWNRFAGKKQAWTFNVFDRIRFYVTSEESLNKAREDGSFEDMVMTSNEPFDLQRYLTWLEEHHEDIELLKNSRSRALLESDAVSEASNPAPTPKYGSTRQQGRIISIGKLVLRAGVAGKCWKRLVEVGDEVEEGQTMFLIEAMKMEIKIQAPWRATCTAIFVDGGDLLDAESCLATLYKHE